MRGRDDGTVIPLLVLGFLLAGTLLAAAVAGSAALVAHRRLAADCDGAALAGATALDRTALATALSAPGPPSLSGTADDQPAPPATADDPQLPAGTAGTAGDPPALPATADDPAAPPATAGDPPAAPATADYPPATAGDPVAGAGPDGGNADGAGGLPLEPVAAARAVTAYLAAAAPGTIARVRTDGTTVTVACTRTARVPFGAVIARPHGIRETATARAGTVLRPST